MLQNVDEIISQPFPINRVFNWRLTNIIQVVELELLGLSPLESGFE